MAGAEGVDERYRATGPAQVPGGPGAERAGAYHDDVGRARHAGDDSGTIAEYRLRAAPAVEPGTPVQALLWKPLTVMSADEIVELAPGAFHLPEFLSLSAQRSVVATVQALAAGAAGFYRPRVRGGGLMHCDMLCLGRHWNARTYSYEWQRTDHDGLPPPPLPPDLAGLAVEAAAAVGFTLDPDICLVNRYGDDGRMGLHQDKDEDGATLAAGVPVVSLSVGAAARFLLGGLRRRESTTAIELCSGDAFVMGGPSRLRYHGVARILRGSEPPALGLRGRVSLTFRQYALTADPT